MFNFRNVLIIFIIGLVAGVLSNGVLIPALMNTNFLNSASIIGKIIKPEVVINKIEKETILIPQSDFFLEAIKKVEPAIVGIQSFAEGLKIRSGSGAVLTQDGLVATIISVVPVNATFLQVTNGGKIYRAKVVLRDYVKNIALISVEESNFQVVSLKAELPELSQHLLVFSEQVNFGKDNPMVEEAMVSQVNKEAGQFRILAGYEPSFYGAALIDNSGAVLGLIDYRNQKPLVIFSKTLNEVLNSYLTKAKK